MSGRVEEILPGLKHFFYYCQMQNPFFFKQHPLTQLLLVVFMVVVGFFVFFILGLVSSLIMFPISISGLLEGLNFEDPNMIPVLKNLQIWQSIGMFIVPSVFVAWFASFKPWNFLGLDGRINIRSGIWVILILIVLMPFMNQLVLWNESMKLPSFLAGIEEWMKEREDMAAGLTNSFLLADNFGSFVVNILMIAIIPAFGEEFFFRGILQKLFGRWFKSTHLAVILASILFSALHFQFYGFFPRLILGLIFGYLFAWSGNLWYPIIAHLFNNLLPVVAFYIYGEEALDSTLDSIGTGTLNWMWVTGSILLATIAIYQFKKLTSSNIKSTNGHENF